MKFSSILKWKISDEQYKAIQEESLRYSRAPISEAIELLHYSTYRLLYDDETRKMMEKRVRSFLEAYEITVGSFQHGIPNPRVPTGQKAPTSEV